jgi:PAS domain S-box-containing protein
VLQLPQGGPLMEDAAATPDGASSDKTPADKTAARGRTAERSGRRLSLRKTGGAVVAAMALLMIGLVWGIGGAFQGVSRLADETRLVVAPRINKQQEYAIFAARMGQAAELVLGARHPSRRAEALREAEGLFGRFAADVDRSSLLRLNEALTAVRRTAARADVVDGLRAQAQALRGKADDLFIALLTPGGVPAAQEPYFRVLRVLDEALIAGTSARVDGLEAEFKLLTATTRVALAAAEGSGAQAFFADMDALQRIFSLRRRMLSDEAVMVDEIRRTHVALNELSEGLTVGAAVGAGHIADTLTELAERGLIAIWVGLGVIAAVLAALLYMLRRHVLAPIGRAAAALERVERSRRSPRLAPALFAELDAITVGVERFGDALVEMHQTAHALREGEERLRTILACSPFPIVIARMSDGEVQYFNWQAEIIFGAEGGRQTLAGDSRFFVDPTDVDRLMQEVATEGIARDVEARLRTADGAVFWALLSAVEIRDGGEAKILIAVNDITQRKKSEEETAAARERAEQTLADLRRTQENLIQAEKMASLGGLVAGVAHEVNTPVGSALTGITYLGDLTRNVTARFQQGLLKRGDFTDFLAAAAEACALIEGNLHRAAELIQSFKQTAVDQTSEERRRFDLAAYLQDVFTSLHPRLRKAGHQVTFDCAPDLMIDSYPGALFQVLTNLTMNTLTHAFPEGRAGNLSLSARLAGPGEVELRFADDGCGILPAHRGRIFDPFFTTRRGAGGSGLGLHIVYNIVHKTLRGTISVDSDESRGTVFTLRFPAVAPTGEISAL